MRKYIDHYLFVLKRFKTSSFLNLLGLSVACLVFSVIIIQVWYDFTFDSSYEKADDIYLLYLHYPHTGFNSFFMNAALPKKIKEEYPAVIHYSLFQRNEYVEFDRKDKAGNIHFHEAWETKTTEGMLDMFTPHIIAGNARSVFNGYNSIMIDRTMAENIFGKQDPIGEVLYYHYSQEPLTIVAVYENFPENATMRNGVYVHLPDDESWMNYNYICYMELNPAWKDEFVARINAEITSEDNRKYYEEHPEAKVEFHIASLKDLHLYHSGLGYGNITTTISLLAIGMLTLLIAFINFINFSIATAPARVKNLNIHKVNGAATSTLRNMLAAEAAFFVLCAFVISLLYALVIKNTFVVDFFSADFSLSHNRVFYSIIGIFLILVGFLFGLYPAFYITSFQPAMALSGSFSTSVKSSKLRNTLVVFQFLAAITLIVVSGFIKLQHEYMIHYSWGMQKENIGYLKTWKMNSRMDIDRLGEELKQNPAILDYTSGQFLPGQVSMRWQRYFEGKQVKHHVWPVVPGFLEFFGIPVLEGRTFSENQGNTNEIILNEEFLNMYGLKDVLGKKYPAYDDADLTIVGIARDVNFQSLREPIGPMAFITMPESLDNSWNNWLFVKLSGNEIGRTLSDMETVWKKYSKEPFDFVFLDQTLQRLYENENKLSGLISLFGLIAVIISVMGVYGLIIFQARYKAKEIAVRKVNGASVKEIIWMLNKSILMQLGIAFLIAVPLSYFIIHRWLEEFAYKIPVYSWVFLAAGIMVLVITLLTISFQSYHAANKNPRDALQKE